MATTNAPTVRLERRDLLASFWRYFWSFQISWNYERMQALGFAYAMEPVLRKLFPNDADYEAALERHLVFFNTNPVVGAPLIIGSAIAMEEAGAPASAQNAPTRDDIVAPLVSAKRVRSADRNG